MSSNDRSRCHPSTASTPTPVPYLLSRARAVLIVGKQHPQLRVSSLDKDLLLASSRWGCGRVLGVWGEIFTPLFSAPPAATHQTPTPTPTPHLLLVHRRRRAHDGVHPRLCNALLGSRSHLDLMRDRLYVLAKDCICCDLADRRGIPSLVQKVDPSSPQRVGDALGFALAVADDALGVAVVVGKV